MKRKQIVAGNWKMNMNYQQGIDHAASVIAQDYPENVQVIMCPPFPFLREVSNMVLASGKKNIAVGAQDCHQASSGAYTGEVSAELIASLGASYVIIGHSERRQYFKESHTQLAQKVEMALSKGLTPIFCCGEPLEIRQKGTHTKLVGKQIRESLFHLVPDTMERIVIAYEPVWAIGTGLTASPEQAQEMHLNIRQLLSRKYGKRLASKISILYGGSCNPKNAQSLFALEDVDGGLIGGASLKSDEFASIITSF